MMDFRSLGIAPTQILLPNAGTSLEKWAVIACDQFTSEPDYWAQVVKITNGNPTALNIIYPECFLSEGEKRIAGIKAHMREYLDTVLEPATNGFILVERQTSSGNRLGLVLAIDLEQYDFSTDSRSLIRATEQTIKERIPPRVKIRQGAPMESPHVMLLLDDPHDTLIAPLFEARDELKKLYDFELMLSGGRIRGWDVGGGQLEKAQSALSALFEKSEGLLFAVGDGNHSLATARQCWLDMKPTLTEAEAESHPARFALCEVVNLHNPSLVFEPIHRAVFNADSERLASDFEAWCTARGMHLVAAADAHAHLHLNDIPMQIKDPVNPLPVAVLQPFLDDWLNRHPEAEIDYIHGSDALNLLAERGACCIRLKAIDKNSLFESVRLSGALPRKTFSMGEARDKRYYLECRAL